MLDAYGKPIVFHDGKANDDILSPAQTLMYGYGNELRHQVGHAPRHRRRRQQALRRQRARQGGRRHAVQAAGKRQFRPGTKFKRVLFHRHRRHQPKTEAGEIYGGFGGIFKITQTTPSADKGRLAIVCRGDAAHSGFDNLAFLDANRLIVVEDGGDKLHGQRNAFDAGYIVDVTVDYAAQGSGAHHWRSARDAMAAIDAGLSGKPGFQNDGDNEITGIHVSDGDADASRACIGAAVPTPFEERLARVLHPPARPKHHLRSRRRRK